MREEFGNARCKSEWVPGVRQPQLRCRVPVSFNHGVRLYRQRTVLYRDWDESATDVIVEVTGGDR